MRAVINELERNAAAVEANIDLLRRLVVESYDAEVWETSDWDWQWPEHQPKAMVSIELEAASGVLPSSVVESIRETYRCYSRAPALDKWAASWGGSETLFLKFICEKLEEYRRQALEKFSRERANLERAARQHESVRRP